MIQNSAVFIEHELKEHSLLNNLYTNGYSFKNFHSLLILCIVQATDIRQRILKENLRRFGFRRVRISLLRVCPHISSWF